MQLVVWKVLFVYDFIDLCLFDLFGFVELYLEDSAIDGLTIELPQSSLSLEGVLKSHKGVSLLYVNRCDLAKSSKQLLEILLRKTWRKILNVERKFLLRSFSFKIFNVDLTFPAGFILMIIYE